jgi:hypothetical protein
MSNNTTTVLPQLRTEAAKAFIDAVSDGDIQLYFMLGRAHAWDSEVAPDTVAMDVKSHYEAWDSAFGLKKIAIADVGLVANRVDWEKDTAYDEYDDDDATIYDSPRTFAVLDTDDLDIDNNKVYKVINNNSGGDSTVEPESDRTGVFGTPAVENDDDFDGYQWVVLYQIEACDFEKFTTADWMYVPSMSAAGTLGATACEDAIPGSVHQVKVTTAGSGYTDGSHRLNITAVDSDGTGFSADAVVVDGAITGVTILAAGQNYTRLALTMPTSAGTGTGETLRAIISPPGGHGSSPINELKPNACMIVATVEGDTDSALTVTNDFRQYGIVAGPKLSSDDSIATGETYDLSTHMTISSIANTSADSTFTLDEWIYVGTALSTATAKARVLEWKIGESTNLKIINIRGTFASGDTIKGDTSGTTATIDTIDQQSTIDSGSGEFIYLANRTAVQRDSEQKEEFKMVISF